MAASRPPPPLGATIGAPSGQGGIPDRWYGPRMRASPRAVRRVGRRMTADPDVRGGDTGRQSGPTVRVRMEGGHGCDPARGRACAVPARGRRGPGRRSREASRRRRPGGRAPREPRDRAAVDQTSEEAHEHPDPRDGQPRAHHRPPRSPARARRRSFVGSRGSGPHSAHARSESAGRTRRRGRARCRLLRRSVPIAGGAARLDSRDTGGSRDGVADRLADSRRVALGRGHRVAGRRRHARRARERSS